MLSAVWKFTAHGPIATVHDRSILWKRDNYWVNLWGLCCAAGLALCHAKIDEPSVARVGTGSSGQPAKEQLHGC